MTRTPVMRQQSGRASPACLRADERVHDAPWRQVAYAGGGGTGKIAAEIGQHHVLVRQQVDERVSHL